MVSEPYVFSVFCFSANARIKELTVFCDNRFRLVEIAVDFGEHIESGKQSKPLIKIKIVDLA